MSTKSYRFGLPARMGRVLAWLALGACSSSPSAGPSPATNTGDDGGSAAQPDASTTGVPDAPSGGDDSSSADGGLPPIGPSCIAALWGAYVQRADGALLHEGTQENVVIDSATGLPLSGITAVLDGGNHGCASLADGSVECWSASAVAGNNQGQLGNGTTTTDATLWRATPVLTAAGTPLTGVSSVANSAEAPTNDTSCAVTDDGRVVCWGDLTYLVNAGTQLYSGFAQAITVDGTTPLESVDMIALGPRTACALVQGASAHEVWCWGASQAGEAGQGSTTMQPYPKKVAGLQDPSFLDMAVGTQNIYTSTVCALDQDAVRCWGDNIFGTAGANTTTGSILSPTPVVTSNGAALSGVVDVEPGCSSFSALRADGTLWTWGRSTGGAMPSSNAAVNYGLTNVVSIGFAGGCSLGDLRYITGDGVYHAGMSALPVNCNAL